MIRDFRQNLANAAKALAEAHTRCENLLFEKEFDPHDPQQRMQREQAIRITQALRSAKAALRV